MNTLVVVTGATASGKTALAIALARHLGCDIISADSRQIYRDLPIGTAAPTAAEQALVTHHLVGCKGLTDYYSAACFEQDALALLQQQWQRSPYAVVCGGSMMYVDALTEGLDALPTISESVRLRVQALLHHHGPEGLLALLEIEDPATYAVIDRQNMRRVAHALEVCLQAGAPYSSLCRRQPTPRPWRTVKLAIDMPRDLLFDRINARVDAMMALGLEQEARRVYHLRHLNALNTVGYKEMFAYFDGSLDRDTATARIAKNTRVYAKKQLTWLARTGVRPAIWLQHDCAVEQALDAINIF